MRKPSELELFIKGQSGQGKTVSTDQAFTLSKEKALEKLSAYQLAFDGPWPLKIVQFAVTNGHIRSLKIDLSHLEATFTFRGKAHFSLADFEEAFFDPTYSGRADLKHLIIGLQKIGFNQKHPFWLSFSEEKEALCWDGECLSRVSSIGRITQDSDCDVKLTISIFPKGKEMKALGFRANIMASGFNAEFTQVLSQRAFVCPIPLTMDGRRLDALQNDPSHGWSPESQLLTMGFSESSMPRLPMPPNTFAHVPRLAKHPDFKTASAAIPESPFMSEFSFAYLLSVNLKLDSNQRWLERSSVCTLHWVLDGVILSSEALTQEPRFLSGGCFASASGLKTDITGFQLQNNDQKSARLQECKDLFDKALDQTSRLDFEQVRTLMVKSNKESSSFFLWVGGAVSVASAFVAPPMAIVQAMLFGAVAAFVRLSGTSEPEKRQAQITECVKQIRQELSGKTP